MCGIAPPRRRARRAPRAALALRMRASRLGGNQRRWQYQAAKMAAKAMASGGINHGGGGVNRWRRKSTKAASSEKYQWRRRRNIDGGVAAEIVASAKIIGIKVEMAWRKRRCVKRA